MNIIYKSLITATLVSAAAGAGAATCPRITLQSHRLMTETREHPYPAEGDTVGYRTLSFQWPLPAEFKGQYDPLDGFDEEAPNPDKSNVVYRVRYSSDPSFTAATTKEFRSPWAMLNVYEPLTPGRWYWQYAYGPDGKWSPIISFVVKEYDTPFLLPSFTQLEAKLPVVHPRILVDAASWDEFRARALNKPEAKWYIEYADNALDTPMKRIEDIDHKDIDKLENQMQVNAYMTQQSRKIIDSEEKNCEALMRAYLLTKDPRYGQEAVNRVMVMTGWDSHQDVVGDFNDGTILSLASMVYDSCHDLLDDAQKKELLDAVARKGRKMYRRFNNYVEAYLFEDHIWQMTMRITAMAALATMDALPEAREWAEYCYNLWVARMPGVNADGGWHNGDSYFSVNTRTLIEVPWLFSRLTGVDFFADPWYDGNIMYTMFQQPPFSKSGGNGSLHQNVGRPNANRIGYLDALARLKHNSYAADFVRRTLAVEPDYLKKSLLSKPADLCWFRLQCPDSLPEGPGLADLPHSFVMPSSGLASGISDWNDHRRNPWWSFRSSPYGSHSHALANQNAFNTFYGGKPLFYSSGHHIEYTDRHAMICHRGSLAHNTILPDGFTQKIGVEGYGWIPRHYTGRNVTYVLGDASNAYGKVESELWLMRGRQSNLEYSEANGWGEPGLKTFRRHLVDLGYNGLVFIYDELEAERPVEWHYRLHSIARPLGLATSSDMVKVSAYNGKGVSDAYIFSRTPLDCEVTDTFRIPAKDWLKAGGKERPNHYHFTGRTVPSRRVAFATVVDTRGADSPSRRPAASKNGEIRVADWTITPRLDGRKFAFKAVNNVNGTVVEYEEGKSTVVTGNGVKSTLSDVLPSLEM